MIIFLGPTNPQFQGGIVEYTHYLAQALNSLEAPLTVISFSRAYPKKWYRGESGQKLSVPKIAGELPILDWLSPMSWIRVWWKIKKLDASMVVVQWWTFFWAVPYLVILSLLRLTSQTKIIIIVHNVTDHEPSWWKAWLSYLVLWLGHGYITHASTLQSELLRMFPHKETTLHLHPIPEGKVALPNKQEAQEKLKVASPLMLFFGIVRPYKGLSVLLEALAQVHKTLPLLHLLVAGDFWGDEKRYKNQIEALGIEEQVIIHNRFIPDSQIATYMAAADVAVFPYVSATGTASTKLALRYCLPIIATEVGDVPDMFALGAVGSMVAAGNPVQLAGAIIDYFSHKRSYQKAIQSVSKQLTWDSLAQSVLAKLQTSHG